MSLVGGIGPSVDSSPIFGVSFLVLATKIMRPGHVYRLMVTNYSPQLVMAHASILRDGLDVASAEQQCSTGVPETIMLRVPPQALDGSYKLKIEGRTETDEIVFANETSLEFSRKSITIFIQTDKPIYKQGQVVKIRTVPITTDLKPFSDALDVYMLDPNGIIVKRWLSKQTNLGSVSIEYPLSDQPVKGNWTVRVFAQGQIQDSHFLVEEYYSKQFEIKVAMPSEILDTEEYIKGSIMANYTSGAPVGGNLTVVIVAEGSGSSASTTESENKFNGFLEFRYKMQDLRRLLNNKIENAKITVAAYVGERYLDLSLSGYAKAVISSSRIKLKFVGPSVFVFKPYMTFDCYIAVSYQGGAALSQDQLRSSLLDVRLTAINKFGSMLLPNRTFEVVTTTPGIWRITIDVRNFINKQTLSELDHLKLDATFFDRFISKASATARVYPSYSPSQRSLQITTSTATAKVGDYAVFHVSSNYKLNLITYVVMTKGLIMTGGRERIRSSPTTFAIPVSAEMVPTSTIFIYDISKNEEVVVDSLAFHVDGTSLQNFTVILNPNKDKHGESLEVAVYGQPGTYVGLTAFNQDLYSLSNTGQLDTINFDQQMQDFDRRADLVSHHWLTQDGRIQEIVNFPSPTQSVDAFHLLESIGLIAFTDAVVPRRSHAVCSQNLVKCLIADKCYNATLSKCNSIDDCGDSSDETNCDKNEILYKTQERLHRVNRLQRLYEDNWLWKDINIGPLGHYIFNVKLPTAISTWSVNAFSMSPHHGIGMLSSPIEISNSRPFLFRVEMPNSCNHGEQISIRALVTNYLPKEIEVNIILANSPNYKFVLVGDSGEVSSYSPETTFGEHQHIITVKSGDTALVYLPIVPQILGDVNVTVSAVTQVAKRTVSRIVHVEPDGIPQNSRIAVDINLTIGSFLIKHLDTNVTESPVVKYDKVRRYIYGSNKASISISGGVVGPMFPTMPMDSNSTLRLPSDCGEQNMFNFAINLLSISYLRQTGQETPDLKKLIFKHLNLLYQKQLSFRNKDGAFRIFKSSSEPSVWLTAFVARYFHQATAQEWENYIYIDPDVIDSAIGWLVSKQTQDGAFVEQGPFAYDRKLDNTPRMGFPLEDYRLKNISLTAYVLIALHSVKDRAGDQATKANNARMMAQRYLESLLHRTTIKTAQDPFDLALVSYALQLVNSIEADEAYVHLEKRLHNQSGLRYWSTEPFISNNVVNVQNNRNLIYPRSRGRYDSRNVQTTAYGLLTLIQRQIPYQRDVVDWLNTQRLSESGWASTQDTLVALQALMEYSLSSDHRSVTDIKVSIEAPALRDINRENRVSISETNISQVHTFNIPNVHGILTVRAEGSGTALLFLDIQYNVDWPHLQIKPAIKAFDLDVRPSYSGRNSSSMNMDICTRWTLLTESSRSGMAVLEVPVPTGYMISQSVLDKIVNASSSATFAYPRNLREARATERRLYFYFDYIDDKKTCVQFTMDRWFPVANMTRFMPVKIYEYYAPEFTKGTLALTAPSLNPPAVVPALKAPLLPPSPSNLNTMANSIGPLLKVAMPGASPPLRVNPAPPKQAQPAPQVVSKNPLPAGQQASGIPTAATNEGNRLRGQINQEEPIIQLDYSSISDEVLNKPTANFVYFNANFNLCRHCQRFFTIWKDLALDIRWWRNVIKLFTINCSEEDNIDVCRRAGVTQFPQLKFYWVMSSSLNQDGQRLRILGKSVHAMRHLMMDKVLESYMEHKKLITQRDRQRASSSAVSNPFNALASMASPNSPLSAIMPMISKMMAATPNSTSSGSLAGLGGLANILGMITGGSKSGSGGGGGGSGGLSITNLMNSVGGMQGLSQMINALMSVASWRRSLTLQPMPRNWPELEAIEVPDTQRLLERLANKGSNVLLIMETQEFLNTGLEVMLDLNPYQGNETHIVRVRDDRSQLSKNLTKLDDVQAPALIYVNELREPKLIMTAPKYTNDEDLRRAFVKAFEKRQIKYPLKRVWPSLVAPRLLTNTSEADEEILSRVNDIYMNDLLNTIRSSLTDQVLRHPDLSDDQYNALVKFVYTLINYFPFNNDEQLKFFKRLHAWLQNQVYPVDVSEYKKQFHDADDVFGKKREWVACKSLSSVNSMPSRKRSGFLFENPSQFGKVVSNITRMFRANQQKVGQLKSIVGMLTSGLNPVMLTNNQQTSPLSSASSSLSRQQQQQQQQGKQKLANAQFSEPPASSTPSPAFSAASLAPPSTSSSSASSSKKNGGGGGDGKQEMSTLEKLIKSLTSGSLGSDSSILKLISTALGGGSDPSKSGKSKFAREYSCGCWKLAHVMVVNEFIKDSPRKDVRHIVLHSLYQYVMHFYACPTCGNRVSDISGEFRLNLDEHLVDQGDSIMLLWKIHNRINKRLESEIRPGSPNKQQFPTEALCPKCRAPKKQTELTSTVTWHEKQVLNFLVHHYRPQNINMNVETPSLSESSPSQSSSSSSSSSSSAYISLPTPDSLMSLPKELYHRSFSREEDVIFTSKTTADFSGMLLFWLATLIGCRMITKSQHNLAI